MTLGEGALAEALLQAGQCSTTRQVGWIRLFGQILAGFSELGNRLLEILSLAQLLEQLLNGFTHFFRGFRCLLG